jgi:hypothetical protein
MVSTNALFTRDRVVVTKAFSRSFIQAPKNILKQAMTAPFHMIYNITEQTGTVIKLQACV